MRHIDIIIEMKRGYAFLTRKNIADSPIGGMSLAVFMLLITLISSLPFSWSLAAIYFMTAFCFALSAGTLNCIVDNFLKAYFPEFHKKAAEFKKRYKKEDVLSSLQFCPRVL